MTTNINEKITEESINIKHKQTLMTEMMHYINIGDYYKIKETHFEALKYWRNQQRQKLLKEINED